MTPRLVLLLSSFPKLSESFIVNHFLGLLEAGWDVHLVCTQNDLQSWPYFPQLDTKPGIKKRVHANWPLRPSWLVVLLFPFAVLYCFFANPGGTLRYFSRSRKILGGKILMRFYFDFPIIALKPDLLHFEFGAAAVDRCDIREFLGCKLVASFRGYDLNFAGLDQPSYYEKLWKLADGFHFLGSDLRKRALLRGCPAEKRYALIPPGIDVRFFTRDSQPVNHPVGTPENPLRILSVGRLEWKKGYEFGFQALRQLEDQGLVCEYRIIGAGSYLEALAFTRHQLGLEDSISFLGGLPREDVIKQLDWADVFLHPAVSEGFGNAVLEAQAFGVPVVCSNADGLAENVQDGVSGFVVPRRNPAALAEKLALLAGSPELRRKMGRAGRNRVELNFQYKQQIERFDCFYREILQST